MFEHLAKWPRILVTGPQRSGTRIATQMIAQDLDYWFVGEEDFGVDSLNQLWKLLQISHNVVIQAPAMSCHAHVLGMQNRRTAIIMMRRDLEEIRASEKRISWRWNMPELLRLNELSGNSANVKYFKWETFQKEDLGLQAYEVEYNSLEQHELWVAKPGRTRFGPRETS